MPGSMQGGGFEEKREYELWILVLLIVVCWPVAIVYYFTRPKVYVPTYNPYPSAAPTYQQPAYQPPAYQPPAYATGGVASPAGAPAQVNPPFCPKCGRPATYIAQYSRYYCYSDQLYV
ncbi:MAG: hypothetical protein L3K09_08100 [Thermoplasmata archaeon]|nr:hypothetical protein [Thermoplasmata archaeon]